MSAGWVRNSVFYTVCLVLGLTFGSTSFTKATQLYCPDDYDAPRLTWSGYINTESWFDTRQSVGFFGNQYIIFPKPKKIDNNGCDINAHPQFGIIPFNLLLSGRLDGPAFFCSKQTYAFFDGDFSVSDESNETIPIWLLRKAYIDFDWGCYAVLVGQENHPMYVSSCFANTVGFSGGEPITTTARAPQIRVRWRPDYFGEQECEIDQHDEISLTFLSQDRVYRNNGPVGGSVRYIQNGVMPSMNLNWQKYLSDTTLWGIGVNLKRIVPRLSTIDMKFQDTEALMSAIAYAYCAHTTQEFALRTQLFYAQDGSDADFISGYAVACEDSITKKRSYVNLRSFSYWLDSELFPGSCLSPGVFLGITRNLGAGKRLFRDAEDNLIIFTTLDSSTVRLVGRIAPRVWYNCGPISFGAEVEWTYAEYGTLNNFGAPNIDPQPVSNVRFLGSMFYKF